MKVERIEELLRAGPPAEPVFLPVTLALPPLPAAASGEGSRPRLEPIRGVRRVGLLPARGRERLALLAATLGAAVLLVLAVAALLGSGERRPLVVPSPSPTGGVVPSTTATPSVIASSSAEPSPNATPEPTPTPAVPAATAVAWTDTTPTPAPSTTPPLVPPGTPPCVAGNLDATIGLEGAGGTILGIITMTNIGGEPCSLEGPPDAIRIRATSGGIADIRYRSETKAGPADTNRTIAPAVLLRIGDAARTSFIWSNWCGARFPSSSVLVTLPGGRGTLSLDGPSRFSSARCDSPSLTSDIVGFAFAPEPPQEPEPPPPAKLVVGLDLPTSTAAGETLHYRVELTNPGIGAAPLTPCPIYTEGLLGSKQESSYRLNCDGSGPSIEPGATLVFDMEFPVPADVVPGLVELHWEFDNRWDARVSGSAQASLTVTTP